MWNSHTLPPTHSVNASGGKELRKPEPLRRRLVSSSSAIRVCRLRETFSRRLNSVIDENTLPGIIVLGLLFFLLGCMFAILTLAPTWLIIVISLCAVPFIFGAAKGT